MKRSGPAEAFFQDHEWARFVLLVLFMAGIAAFAVWRVVVELSDHSSQRGWLVLSLTAGLVLCLVAWPTVLGVSSAHPPWGPARKLSRSARLSTALAVSAFAVIALLPKHSSLTDFWQPGWLQLVGSGFWLGFAGLLLHRRSRQKAWHGVGPDEHPV